MTLQAASLSLARLNASYLKAKDKVKEQEDELSTIRAERDSAFAELRSLKAAMARSSTMTMPLSPTGGTPATSAFDYSSFPVPPQIINSNLLSPPVSRSNTTARSAPTRSPPVSPAPETPSSATHWQGQASGPASSPLPVPSLAAPSSTDRTLPSIVIPDYRFPPVGPCPSSGATAAASVSSDGKSSSNGAFCSLPTPPVSAQDAQSLRGGPPSSPAASPASTSRFRAFADKVFNSGFNGNGSSGGTRSAPSSMPPVESDLLWTRLGERASPVGTRSASTPSPLLDPYADQFSPEVETLRFMPRKSCCLARLACSLRDETA